LRRTANLSSCDSALRTNPRSCVVGTQIENFAFTVSRSPQPELSARKRHGHFVEMPLRGRSIASAVKFSSKDGPMSNASSHRLSGDILPRAATKSSILGKPSVKHDVPVDRRRDQQRTEEIVVLRHLSGQAEQRRRSRDKARGAARLVNMFQAAALFFNPPDPARLALMPRRRTKNERESVGRLCRHPQGNEAGIPKKTAETLSR
jgi:hypothetical protein